METLETIANSVIKEIARDRAYDRIRLKNKEIVYTKPSNWPSKVVLQSKDESIIFEGTEQEAIDAGHFTDFEEIDAMLSIDLTLGGNWSKGLTKEDIIKNQLPYLPKIINALVRLKLKLYDHNMTSLHLVIWMDDDAHFWIDSYNDISDYIAKRLIFHI